jgi:PAS domain S-box-containing protein
MNPEAVRPEPKGQRTVSLVGPTVGSLEPVFGGLAQLAASVCHTPIASLVVNSFGATWCSASGMLPAAAVPPHDPFSEHTTDVDGLFEVRNAKDDVRFRDSECVAGPRAIQFYAGIALLAANRDVLGTLAVYDSTPRELSPEQRSALLMLAQQCASQVELRARLAENVLVSGCRPAATTDHDDATLAFALVESAPVAIYHTDVTGNLTYVNPAYRRIFGLTPEQSVNDWAQGVHPDDRARMEHAWADFCAQPRPVRFEYRTEPRARGVRFFAEQVVAAEGASGFVGTITDVTDLIAARDNLRRVETLFRNTFEQLPVGIAYARRDGQLFRCNRALAQMLGFSVTELESRSMAELTHADDVERSHTEIRRLWGGENDSYALDARYLRKDQTIAWVRVTGSLVRDGDGAAEYAVAFIEDITSRKATEIALRQSQDLIEVVVADLPVALLACDVAGQITHYNRAAVELFSIRAPDPSGPESPVRHPLAAEIHLADGVTQLNRRDHPLARALRGETISNLELVIVPCGSTPRTTLSNARRLVGSDGQTLGAVAVTQDITERKLSDLELERVHKQLMAASRQAGMAEVATNVLHNVGNTLNSVNISASLVAERIKQSKAPGVSRVAGLLKGQGRNVGDFITADDRGKQIPDYLATLGKQLVTDQKAALQELASLRENLEHIKDTVAMQQNYAKLCGVTETVKVVDLVEDSLRLNAGAFARHGVTVRREFNAVPPITVDKHKVLQILVNLVRNAKYACDESGRQDKLLTLRISGHASGVCISVIDNGVGIPAENISRIFNHGFTTRLSGHGFGLHSGALAAKELGGSLRAESDGPGRGATFILALPYAPADAAHA